LRFRDITLDDLRSLASEGLLRASRSFDPSLGTPFRRWANRRIRDCLAEGLRQWAHLPRYRVRSDRQRRRMATGVPPDGLTTVARPGADDPRLPRADSSVVAVSDASPTESSAFAIVASRVPIAANDALPTSGGAAKSSKDDLLERCIAMAVVEETVRALDRQARVDPEQVASGRELLQRLREAIDRLPSGQRVLIERHDLGEESLPEVARALGISKSWATRLRMRALAALSRELQGDLKSATGERRP